MADAGLTTLPPSSQSSLQSAQQALLTGIHQGIKYIIRKSKVWPWIKQFKENVLGSELFTDDDNRVASERG